MSFVGLIEDIAKTASLPLNRARTLPRAAYVDEAYFAHEAEHVLGAGWLCAAHVSQLKQPGAILPVDFLSEPIMLVRAEDGVIRAFSRVCPHRSSDVLLAGEAGGCMRASVITCPYHRWSFALSGRLIGAPQMQQAEGFDKSDWRLSPVRSAIWQGFIFVNLDGQAPELETQYAELGAFAAPWRMQEMELVIALDWACDFNWKVMVENWIESYHHLGPHTKTLNPYMPAQDTWSEQPNPHYIHAHLPMTGQEAARIVAAIRNGEAAPGFVPVSGLTLAQQCEWNLFVGFPCFMLLLARDRVIWYRLQPISAGRCRLTTTILAPRESLAMPDFETVRESETKMLQDFHIEDMGVNAAVQRGLHSRHVARGRLSHLEEPVWQFHRLLAGALEAAR